MAVSRIPIKQYRDLVVSEQYILKNTTVGLIEKDYYWFNKWVREQIVSVRYIFKKKEFLILIKVDFLRQIVYVL